MTESPDLPADIALLVHLSAALAFRETAELEERLRSAQAHPEPVAVDEAILQAWPFVGFPATLEAMSLWRRLRGVPATEDDPLASPEFAPERAVRGEAMCRTVYGSAYEALRRNVGGAHPALDRWMVETGYGTVLGRPGLPPAIRELCVVAVLAAQGWDRQLHSHLRGAVRNGAPREWVEAALRIGLARTAHPDADRLVKFGVSVLDGVDAFVETRKDS